MNKRQWQSYMMLTDRHGNETRLPIPQGSTADDVIDAYFLKHADGDDEAQSWQAMKAAFPTSTLTQLYADCTSEQVVVIHGPQDFSYF